MDFSNSPHLPYLPTLGRIALALALGFFIGMERERRGKDAGVRTFSFVSLLGCIGALMGDQYAILAVLLVAMLMAFLNIQRLQSNGTSELTTAAALAVTCFMGVLCGKGHTFAPVAVGLVTAGLLAWKEKLTDFSVGLTEAEVRSAILLGLLSFVIYPVLPKETLDPWGLVDPRATWGTVILIAAIGFVNYILWKAYGARGVELTGFLGGLINSTVAVTELATRVRESGAALVPMAYRGVLLATTAMVVRNAVLLGILAPQTLSRAALPLSLMCAAALAMAYLQRSPATPDGEAVPVLRLESPFSLQAALKYGAVFLALHVAGTLAQQFLGNWGVYAVSAIGGLVSSASAVASAATMASHNQLSAIMAGNSAVLASMASIVVNLPLVSRVGRHTDLVARLRTATFTVMGAGFVGILIQSVVLRGS